LLVSIWMIFWVENFKTSPDCDLVKNETLLIKKNHLNESEDFCRCEFSELKVKKIDLSDLPPCVFKDDLKSIHIENVGLNGFPKEVLNMPQLESLTIKYANLETLPCGLSKLRSLKNLDLRGTLVMDLPDGLDHVKRIDMRNIDMDSERQQSLRDRYPKAKIFFSPPCNCN